MKVCSRCHEEKLGSEFYKNKSYNDGLDYYCIECRKEYRNHPRKFKDDTSQECTKCGHIKDLKEFYNSRNTQNGKQSWCIDCTKSRNAYEEKYKLSSDKFNELFNKFDGCCWICFRKLEDIGGPRVDHDHKCCPKDRTCGECTRGILCDAHNKALGGFGDNISYLQGAIDYLKMFQ